MSKPTTFPLPPSPRGYSTLKDKMTDELLRKYVRNRRQHQHSDDDDGAPTSAWRDVKSTAARISANAPIHNVGEMSIAVKALASKYPSLPQDTPRHFADDASSAAATTPKKHVEHVFDQKPCERLSSRGSGMFPPLQKTSPRSSSAQARHRTATSSHLVDDERRIAAHKFVHQPYLAHHFGKANAESARRKRNTNATRRAEEAVSGRRASRTAAASGAEGAAILETSSSRAPASFRHLTEDQVRSVATNYRVRYGAYFTAPVVETALDDPDQPSLLMTDQMMDRLREKERQRATRAALDREVELRRRAQEKRARMHQGEVLEERAVAEQVAAEAAADKEARIRKREEQRAMAQDLKRAERRRQARQDELHAEKERYAAFALEQNVLAKQREEQIAERKRQRRVETSKMNEELAQRRTQRRVAERAREKVLEQAELEFIMTQ